MMNFFARLAGAFAFLVLASCTPGTEQVPAQDAPLYEVAMERVSGVPVVQLAIGDSGPLNFMIDSGFDVNVLDSEVARQLGLRVGAAATENAPGGDIGVASIDAVDVSVNGKIVSAVTFSGIDIAGLGAFIGRPVAGILGHDFLSRFAVDLDYAGQRMRLWDSEAWRYDGDGAVVPLHVVDREVLVDCMLTLQSGRQVTAPFKFDTGSLDVAGLALNFVRDQNVIEPGTPELNVTGVGVGGATSGRLFRVRAFQIGNITIQQAQLGYDVDSSGFENRTNAGTVGADAFSRGRIILDYAKRQLILDSPYAGPQTEEYRAGLVLVSAPPTFDQINVYQVMPTSAAARAGIQAGDTIVAINGAHLSLLDARRALQSDAVVSVRYRHGETEATVTLHPAPLTPLIAN